MTLTAEALQHLTSERLTKLALRTAYDAGFYGSRLSLLTAVGIPLIPSDHRMLNDLEAALHAIARYFEQRAEYAALGLPWPDADDLSPEGT